MDLYREQVVPRLVNVLMADARLGEVRQRVCAGLSGDVLEIGFGSGLNVPHYPAAVRNVAAVEPSEVGWRLASKRLTAAVVPVERSGLDGQHLPFADGSFDAALSTWTLCTIPDAVAALRELRRVLRPGAALYFAEHGLAPDVAVARWQHRLTPVQRRLAGGCHPDRPIADLLVAAGLRVQRLQTSYQPRTPRFLGYLYEGVAAG